MLEDQRPGDEASLKVIETWLRDRNAEGGLNIGTLTRVSNKSDPIAARIELLDKGLENVTAPEPGKNAIRRTAAAIFAQSDELATISNLGFAALLSLRTRYPSTAPKLTLGTILRTVAPGKGLDFDYLLCLQPKCDSVRIKHETGFPLMPLQLSHQRARFAWVLQDPDGEWIYLDIDTTPGTLCVSTFLPQGGSASEIVANKQAGGFFFFDTAGTRYQWVAALKDEHALHVAAEVSKKLARPGPNDSAWLRLPR